MHNAAAIIVTFEPHTRAFLHPGQKQQILTTFDEKALILHNFNIDYLIRLPFDRQLAEMDPQVFIQKIIIDRYKGVEWVMGENHLFGKNKKGSYNFLHTSPVKNHFNVFEVSLHAEEGGIASSTKIRTLIGGSRMQEAVSMLGHPYLIITERIRGIRKGYELGYPPGVYAAEVEYKEITLQGALYYGNCPTFESRDFHFEFHSLDPVVYDPGIHTIAALWIISYIRPDMTFSSQSLLVDQIKKDINTIKRFFKKE
jgi:riboflavin kinase/FMN adenylyltransferase